MDITEATLDQMHDELRRRNVHHSLVVCHNSHVELWTIANDNEYLCAIRAMLDYYHESKEEQNHKRKVKPHFW